MASRSAERSAAAPDTCPCEARIPASILEGYACGNPACWRTAVAKASFDDFVADLVARRGDAPPETAAAPNGPPPLD